MTTGFERFCRKRQTKSIPYRLAALYFQHYGVMSRRGGRCSPNSGHSVFYKYPGLHCLPGHTRTFCGRAADIRFLQEFHYGLCSRSTNRKSNVIRKRFLVPNQEEQYPTMNKSVPVYPGNGENVRLPQLSRLCLRSRTQKANILILLRPPRAESREMTRSGSSVLYREKCA